jgi:hypothetical protein
MSVIVRSNSSRNISSIFFTPASPSTASPNTEGLPTYKTANIH